MAKTNLSKIHGRTVLQIIKDKDISRVLRDVIETIDKLSQEIETLKAEVQDLQDRK